MACFFVLSETPEMRHVMLSQIICTALCALAMRTSTSSNACSYGVCDSCVCVQCLRGRPRLSRTGSSRFQQSMMDSKTSADCTRKRCSRTRLHRSLVRVYMSDKLSSFEDQISRSDHSNVDQIRYKTRTPSCRALYPGDRA